MKRVAFLLGAGSSIPAGYSSTNCLTKQIRFTKEYHRHTSGKTLHVGDSAPDTALHTPLVQRIIDWLFQCTQKYFCWRGEVKEVSYEDIYFLALQLADEATELQNPALLPIFDQLRSEMPSWPKYKRLYEDIHRNYDDVFGCTKKYRAFISSWCMKVCHYIEDIVEHKLSKPYQSDQPDQHLKPISAVLEAEDLGLKGIATLAHDTHVETYLRKKNIRLADGFSDSATDCGWRVWKNQFSAGGFVPFVKLHGSVDWKYLTSISNMDARRPLLVRQHTVGICSRPPSEIIPPHGAGTGSKVWELSDKERPKTILLIGTFNKPAQYSWNIMLDIHYRFRKILEDSETLIVCGYSFGDKAINTEIIQWHASPKRSLVVIDCRSQKELIRTARCAAATNLLKKGLKKGTTQFISEKMEKVCPDQLMALL